MKTNITKYVNYNVSIFKGHKQQTKCKRRSRGHAATAEDRQKKKTPKGRITYAVVVWYGMYLNSGHAQRNIQQHLPPLTGKHHLITT